MIPTFRWYGADDPVTLQHIRQIPGMVGIVGSLFDLPPGALWTVERIQALQGEIAVSGLRLEVIESVNIHEAIKLGLPERDQYIAAYQQTLRNLSACGVRVVCYNFMPVFDWARTDLAMPLPDGSNALSFNQADLAAFDFSRGLPDMPAWANSYNAEELQAILMAYETTDEAALFANLVYFLEAVVPVAEEVDVKLAIHPDDPPWSIFGLPRIVRDAETLQRIFDAVPSRHNGLTFCTGSLGANPDNPLVEMVEQFGERIHFAHLRNVKHVGEKHFHESEHPSRFGYVDMVGVIRGLLAQGRDIAWRPDHGRMIWGETGKPGYGLYDRALGAMYIQGVVEGLRSG
jgi:mannonate dehydratase